MSFSLKFTSPEEESDFYDYKLTEEKKEPVSELEEYRKNLERDKTVYTKSCIIYDRQTKLWKVVSKTEK